MGKVQPLGLVLTTSPHTDRNDRLRGNRTNLLIALDSQQRGDRAFDCSLAAIRRPTLTRCGRAMLFGSSFVGWKRDAGQRRVEGVSGLDAHEPGRWPKRSSDDWADQSRRSAFPEPVTIAEVQTLFPTATGAKGPTIRASAGIECSANKSKLLGFAVRHVAIHRQRPRLSRSDRGRSWPVAPDARNCHRRRPSAVATTRPSMSSG